MGVSEPGARDDEAHGLGQLRLGAQQLLGVDQREQLGGLVPAGLGDVALDLADDGEQGGEGPAAAHSAIAAGTRGWSVRAVVEAWRRPARPATRRSAR